MPVRAGLRDEALKKEGAGLKTGPYRRLGDDIRAGLPN